MIDTLVANFPDNVFNFTHFVLNMWGTQAAFPDLRLTDLFTDEGADAIDRVASNKCVHVAADTLNYNYGATYKSMVKPKPTNALAWSRALIDGSVRKLGGNVTRIQLEGNQTHFSTPGKAAPLYVAWIKDGLRASKSRTAASKRWRLLQCGVLLTPITGWGHERPCVSSGEMAAPHK